MSVIFGCNEIYFDVYVVDLIGFLVFELLIFKKY